MYCFVVDGWLHLKRMTWLRIIAWLSPRFLQVFQEQPWQLRFCVMVGVWVFNFTLLFTCFNCKVKFVLFCLLFFSWLKCMQNIKRLLMLWDMSSWEGSNLRPFCSGYSLVHIFKHNLQARMILNYLPRF